MMRIGLDKMKKRALTATAVVVAGVLLSLISSVKQVSAEPLRVGVYRGVISALIYVANAQGLFKKQSVDVVMNEYGTGVMAVSDLLADKVDIATGAEFAFVLQSFKHPSLRIPAAIWTGSNHDLIVRTDHGIKKPQDLKSKRVAVVRGSSMEFFLYHYLIFNNIPAGSIKVVYLEPSEMVNAMADGTVDATLSWPPYTSEMTKRLGAKVARWPAQSGQDYYIVLAVKEGFLRKQPKTMERFLAALSEAEGFVAKYPDRAQTLLSQRLGLEATSVLEMWSGSRFGLQLTQDLLVLMELEAKWAMRNNLVQSKEVPNYLDFFYFSALDKVKPEAVGIIH